MIAPLEATATKIGSGSVHAGAPSDRQHQERQRADELDGDAVRTSCRGRPAVDQPAGHPAGADQPGGVDAEGDAVADLGQADDVLVDERRGRDVGHHHAEATARRPRPGRGTPRCAAPSASRPASTACRCSCVRSAGCVSGTTSSTPSSIAAHRAGDRPEHAPPADRVGQQAADQRRQHRRHATDGDHQREGLGRRPAGDDVGDDRAADDHATGAGEALHQSGDHEDGQVRRDRADDAGHDADGGARHQRPAPTEAVGQRSHHQLAERQPDQERGQGQLDAARARRRAPSPIAGKPGQVEVGRDRRDRGQRREHEQQRPADRRCPWRARRVRHRASPPGCGRCGTRVRACQR